MGPSPTEILSYGVKALDEAKQDEGGISYNPAHANYPEHLDFVNDQVDIEHKYFELVHFHKEPGIWRPEDSISFFIEGYFRPYSEEPWIGGDGSIHNGGPDDARPPLMANVRVTLEPMAVEKASGSKLDVTFTWDATNYGDGKDPRMIIHVEGYYEPAGLSGFHFKKAAMLNAWGQFVGGDASGGDAIHIDAAG